MSNQAQAIAVLEWYQAMGVDEWVEETPQNRLIAPQIISKTPTAIQELPTPATPTSTPTAYHPPAALVEKTEALAAKANTIAELRDVVMGFKELTICKTATQPVFADGVVDAELMVIGEAPGAQEDRQGIPFCGPSGQLLDKMLEAIDMSRTSNSYITNTVFWRPPGNRTPTPEEIAICQPFVRKHIELIKPRAILLLGGIAVRSVMDEQTSISRLRGKEQRTQEIQTVVSYHPSYLLRQPTQKKLAWQDLLRIKALLTGK